MPLKKRTQTLATKKLKSSGLSLQAAKELGIEILEATEVDALYSTITPGVPALKFLYHDVEGNVRKDTHRVRLLEPAVNQFGQELDLRYLQPSGTPPAAYLPRSMPWNEIAADTECPVLITEGELKAACACENGYACIGLGGVSSWRSARRGWALLPELEKFRWVGRPVVVVFDSDAKTNPNVFAASMALVQTLTERGAVCEIADLPDLGDGKTGLDDYIVSEGADAFEAVVDTAESDELALKLWEYNGRFALVRTPGCVYDFDRDAIYEPSKFHNSIFSNEWANREVVGRSGVRLEKTKVAKAWLEWPLRRQYDKFTYSPGGPHEIDGALNTWVGFGVEAKRGDVKLWKQLLDHLFASTSKVARRWFEQWLFYPIRFPGTKLATAVGIWSTGQGLGKSCIGTTIARLYGEKNSSIISQAELEDNFTGWAAGKQFIMVDDVSAHDSRAKADILKKIITQERALVNIKHIPTYYVPDHANYFITSNKSNALYLDERDRRFFIHEVVTQHLGHEFFDEYFTWLNDGGAEALMYYARNVISFKGFYPHRPPPDTEAKAQMKDSAKSEVELWLTELRDEPSAKLQVGKVTFKRDVYTPRELVEFFEQERKGRVVTVNQMGIRAREYFQPIQGGKPLRINGHPEKFFAVRNQDKWLRAPVKKLEEHVTACRRREGGEGKF